jgi:methylmalonyl-CoA/ethylmalonyl-CoA epimerase
MTEATLDSQILFDHIAVGVADPASLTPLLVGEFGGAPYSAGPGIGFVWFQYRFRGGGLLEVLEPDGPSDGFMHRFVGARGAGVHHVTFKVPEHAAALDRAERLGFEIVGLRNSDPGWKEAFLHPRQAQGIVVQIVEAAGDESGSDWQRPPFPPAPRAHAEPVELRGLRLSAHRADAAKRQWGDLLGGQPDHAPDGLVFRWPGSPMQIHVSIDPEHPEGPTGLEVATVRRLMLPEGPHPMLGTAIFPVTCGVGA